MSYNCELDLSSPESLLKTAHHLVKTRLLFERKYTHGDAQIPKEEDSFYQDCLRYEVQKLEHIQHDALDQFKLSLRGKKDVQK